MQSAHSFSFGDYFDIRHQGHGNLLVINDDTVAGGKGFGTHGHRDMKIISYVLVGELAHKDSMGNGESDSANSGIVRPGDVQRMSAGTDVKHSEFNNLQDRSTHFLQIWIALSDPAMEESLYDITPLRQFAGLSLTQGSLPDEINAMLGERGMLLRRGTIVDASISSAPSSTKNKTGKRDPEMHQTKKGNQWHFGMKAYIGVDAESGLVHTVTGTGANAHDVTEMAALLHGQESAVYANSGYTGAAKRQENQGRDVDGHIAAKPSAVRRLDPALQAQTQ